MGRKRIAFLSWDEGMDKKRQDKEDKQANPDKGRKLG